MIKTSLKDFENNFLLLLKKGKHHPVSLKQFLNALSGKGKILFLIFFVLPFSQIPGLSVFFGLLIFYLGLRIGFNKKSIWLPRYFLQKKIPPYLLKQSVNQIVYALKIFRKWTRPRYVWATETPLMHSLNGIMIAIVGFFIFCCPPIPLTGLLAFSAILLIGIGLLNDDGIYILIGYVLTIGYLILVIFILEIFSLSAILEFAKNLITRN